MTASPEKLDPEPETAKEPTLFDLTRTIKTLEMRVASCEAVTQELAQRLEGAEGSRRSRVQRAILIRLVLLVVLVIGFFFVRQRLVGQ